jgi:hypothetical protein
MDPNLGEAALQMMERNMRAGLMNAATCLE